MIGSISFHPAANLPMKPAHDREMLGDEGGEILERK